MVPVIKQESSDNLGHLACLLSLSLLKVAAPHAISERQQSQSGGSSGGAWSPSWGSPRPAWG